MPGKNCASPNQDDPLRLGFGKCIKEVPVTTVHAEVFFTRLTYVAEERDIRGKFPNKELVKRRFEKFDLSGARTVTSTGHTDARFRDGFVYGIELPSYPSQNCPISIMLQDNLMLPHSAFLIGTTLWLPRLYIYGGKPGRAAVHTHMRIIYQAETWDERMRRILPKEAEQ